MDVYKDYYCKMVTVLPMDDDSFTAKLYSLKLLPGDTKDKLNSKPTKVEKATYFLDTVITPALNIADYTSFHKLLEAMEKYDSSSVTNLAKEIKGKLLYLL